MFKKIILSYIIWRACVLASKKKEKKALELLNKYTDLAEEYKNISIDYYILKATLNYEFENYDKAQKDFELSTEILTEIDYYSVDEKMYLYAYIYGYLSYIFKNKGKEDWRTFYELSHRKNFEIDKVREYLKSNFPLN